MKSVIQGHLDYRQGAILQSATFLQTVIKALQQLLSNQLKTATQYITDNYDSIPFYRKSVIFKGQATQVTDFQGKICMAFFSILYKKIYERYKDTDVSTWYNFSSLNEQTDLLGGSLLIAARKAMISNIGLPPLVIAEHHKLNKIGLPLHYPIRQPIKHSNPPENIVYISK